MNCLIQLIDLSLYFPNQLCFESFSQAIHFGDRIALIGDNGSGKSNLLKIIAQTIAPSEGLVRYASGVTVSYIPQLYESGHYSGAEQFNRCLTQALAKQPDVLLLDEPTNHLDKHNRLTLMRMLAQFYGTLIVATHDLALLQQQEYTFWQFKNNWITPFTGHFSHLKQQDTLQRQVIQQELNVLYKEKKQNHNALMQEQKRAKNARLKGEKAIEQAKWPTIVSKTKVLRAQQNSGKKKKALSQHKEQLIQRLAELRLEEEINPQFILPRKAAATSQSLVTIHDGTLFYADKLIVKGINLNITLQSRLALCGKNGSGKSTVVKAIMGDVGIRKEGLWSTPALTDIGYLDQHYQQIKPKMTVLDTISERQPLWNHNQIRTHLNNFLFRKNEQVHALVDVLSGGEKARLNLACIAAKPPKLLILDEVTNNLDLKTRNHVIKLLRNYPGPFIVISHDEDFLENINLNDIYTIDA